jgi:hypothetical protein
MKLHPHGQRVRQSGDIAPRRESLSESHCDTAPQGNCCWNIISGTVSAGSRRIMNPTPKNAEFERVCLKLRAVCITAYIYLVEAIWYKPVGRGFDSR